MSAHVCGTLHHLGTSHALHAVGVTLGQAQAHALIRIDPSLQPPPLTSTHLLACVERCQPLRCRARRQHACMHAALIQRLRGCSAAAGSRPRAGQPSSAPRPSRRPKQLQRKVREPAEVDAPLPPRVPCATATSANVVSLYREQRHVRRAQRSSTARICGRTSCSARRCRRARAAPLASTASRRACGRLRSRSRSPWSATLTCAWLSRRWATAPCWWAPNMPGTHCGCTARRGGRPVGKVYAAGAALSKASPASPQCFTSIAARYMRIQDASVSCVCLRY